VKWMVMGLIAALVLIAAGVVLTGGEGGNTAVSADPEAAQLCEEGTEDYHAFRLKSAIDKLGKALELDAALAEASIARTFAFWRLGRSEDFKGELARADSLTALIHDDKRRMLAQLRLSSIMSSHAFAFRDSLLERLAKEMPRNIYVLAARAGAATMDKDVDAREKAWRDILEVDPNYANSYNMLGYLELDRGNYEKAIENMKKYAFLAPDLANPHDSLGEVLMTMGRYEEAEEEFRAAVMLQRAFYFAWINLGRTYLARGQIETGRDILEKVRGLVSGTELEKDVDRQMVDTYVINGLIDELDRVTASYVARYPDDHRACVYRAIRLAYLDRVAEGQAVMDSCLAAWRAEDYYAKNEKSRFSIDYIDRKFDALVADVADDPATALRAWRRVVDLAEDELPLRERWYDSYRLAAAQQGTGRPEEALATLEPVLTMNPRNISVLVLATRCYLDLRRADDARRAVDQLEWCVAKADAGFPARARAAELKAEVTALEGNP